MKIIRFEDIAQLQIPPSLCLQWVKYMLLHKYECDLPTKISLKMENNIFVNTMPSYIPMIERYGVKIVSRYPERKPALLSDILLYDAHNGETLALMDGTWITAMRTGSVAALSIFTLQKSDARIYAFMGLGNTARATLTCLLELMKGRELYIKLLVYKQQELDFIERFKAYPQLHFQLCHTPEELIQDADVVVSCVTAADTLIAPDACFKEGVLAVPVHTRGFQNCDLFFDKVFADDTHHVESFKYFSKFKKYAEFSRILLKENPGRENDSERILAYNIGISLHDIYFASQVYDRITTQEQSTNINPQTNKFWL